MLFTYSFVVMMRPGSASTNMMMFKSTTLDCVMPAESEQCSPIQSGSIGGGMWGHERRCYTHHDDASRLLSCAHAHDGRHANGGALEVNPAATDRSRGGGGSAQI